MRAAKNRAVYGVYRAGVGRGAGFLQTESKGSSLHAPEGLQSRLKNPHDKTKDHAIGEGITDVVGPETAPAKSDSIQIARPAPSNCAAPLKMEDVIFGGAVPHRSAMGGFASVALTIDPTSGHGMTRTPMRITSALVATAARVNSHQRGNVRLGIGRCHRRAGPHCRIVGAKSAEI